MQLPRLFFERKTITVAKELLGKFLVRKIGREEIRAIITETEAYCGSRDLACHASRGRTKRTEVMFGPAGHAYVYLIYGIYYCLNIVTEAEDYPAAVLIRGALTPERAETSKKLCAKGAAARLVSGPGKLCRFLKIDKSLNGEDMIESKRLWVEDAGLRFGSDQVKRSKRIGVNYAGPYKNKLWRFVLYLSCD